MKILYVCGTYIPASGGSEKSSHTLLRELVKRGHRVLVVTGFGPGARKERIIKDGVRVLRIDNSRLLTTLDMVKNELKPDVILTQLIWSDKVLKWAKSEKLPTAYFVRSVGGRLNLTKRHPLSPDIIFSNSKNTAQFVRKKWCRSSVVVYPIVDFKDYIVKNRRPVYLTMFNPVKIKGGEIFKRIALEIPEYKFLAVEGWHHLKEKSFGRWDYQKMRLMANAYGEKEVLIPEEVDLSGIKNIKYIKAVKDVRKIYQKTKILLLPSLWEEASARVIREAMVNGIPVIASDTGGTREVIDKGGIVIENYLKTNSWIQEIKKFDNEEYYINFSKIAKREALKFNYHKEINKVELALKTIISRTRLKNEDSSYS